MRADFFHANPHPVTRMRIAHLLKVELPPENELMDLSNRLKQFTRLLNTQKINIPVVQPNEDILLIQDNIVHLPPDVTPIERGVGSLVSILEHEVQKQQELTKQYEGGALSDKMSAFTPIAVTDIVEQMIGPENIELFALPLIRRGSTMEDLKHIERLAGTPAEEAERVAENLLNDIEKVTAYPPDIEIPMNKHKFMDSLNQALAMLGGEQYYDSHMLGKSKLAAIKEEDGAAATPAAAESHPDLPELPDLPILMIWRIC